MNLLSISIHVRVNMKFSKCICINVSLTPPVLLILHLFILSPMKFSSFSFMFYFYLHSFISEMKFCTKKVGFNEINIVYLHLIPSESLSCFNLLLDERKFIYYLKCPSFSIQLGFEILQSIILERLCKRFWTFS